MIIAFDIDGTLQGRYKINQDMFDLLYKFKELGADIIVWSGGGEDYATRFVQKHNLPAIPSMKRIDIKPDLVIDDINTTQLGIINLYCKYEE